jgi:steroid delta-isomerase-like uncharacterized protein
MSSHDARKVVQTYFDAFDRHDIPVFNNLLATNYKAHANFLPPEVRNNRDNFIHWIDTFDAAFAGYRLIAEDIVASEDKVAARWRFTGKHTGPLTDMNLPATGKQVTYTGTNIFRVVDGKIAEQWLFPDAITFMRQLGVLPEPQTAATR